MQREFTSNDVIALTGISARQLQWWDERGIVAPGRQGHRRIYTWDKLVTVAVICQLRRRGFSLQRMRKVIGFLRQEFGTSLATAVSASSEYHLLNVRYMPERRSPPGSSGDSVAQEDCSCGTGSAFTPGSESIVTSLKGKRGRHDDR